MSQKPSEKEVVAEMNRIGGGGDFFAARDRLLQRLAETDRAVAKLKSVGSETDAAPWRIDPSELEIDAEMSRGASNREDGRAMAAKRLVADARRLAAVSTMAAEEISSALDQAEAAREKAANLLMEHEAALTAVTNGIFGLVVLRQKISIVKSLLISDDNKRQIAHAALDNFVSMKTGGESIATSSGFRAMSEDLAFRTVLNDHIAEYVAPMKRQAATAIATIRSQAQVAGIDLKKVLALLSLECAARGSGTVLGAEDCRGLITDVAAE